MKYVYLISLLLVWPISVSAQFLAQGSTLSQVGIDQNLGQQIPLDLVLTDETGRQASLRSRLHDRPAILELVYYGCPMLCTQSLNGLARSLNALPESAGTDFDVVTVSFDPKEMPALAAEKKKTYLSVYTRPGAAGGWNFYTADSDTIRRLTAAAGFRYHWDVASNSFAHSSALIVLTPSGKISRYLFGVEYDSTELHQALLDAKQESTGPLSEVVLLYCLRYDPASGRYSLMISRAVQLFGAATLLALAGFIGVHVVRDRHRHAAMLKQEM